MDIKSAIALFIIRSLGLMNLTMARKFGHFIGWLLKTTNSRAYKVTRKNIELCFSDKTPAQQLKLANESIVETGKTIAETGVAWAGTYEKLRQNETQVLSVKNVHLFDEAVAKKKGILLLTMHYGNWEWYSCYLPERCNSMGLYKMAKLPGLEKAMLKARESSGMQLIPATASGVKTYIEHYKNHGACLIVPDQEPSEKSGVWADFFGINTLTPKFIHHMIQQNPEGTVLNTYMKRIKGGFELVFNEVEADIYSEDLLTSAVAMNKGFETCIADAPSQYQWEYKRFKRNPKGYYKGL